MKKVKKPEPAKADLTATGIYTVVQLVPIKGDVIRGHTEIDVTEAIALRQQGKDVVVCGNDLGKNRELAKQLETTAQGGARAEHPHKAAGPNALPHFQPLMRPPAGHTFYETAKKKARKMKP